MITHTYEQTQGPEDPGGTLWTVGFTDTTGRWIGVSDWEGEDEARAAAEMLNRQEAEMPCEAVE
jgi:hypothetical protein